MAALLAVGRSAVRTSAFLRKEIVEVLRQPRLLVVLVLGPFLVLLVFGSGLREGDPPVRTKFVVDAQSPIADQIERFADAQDQRLTVQGLTEDRDAALAELRSGQLDLVVVIPDDALQTIREDQRAEVTAFHDQMDPIEAQAIDLFTRTAVDEINQLVLRRLVSESQEDAERVQQRIDAAKRSVADLRARADEPGISRARQDLAALALVIGPTAALLGELTPAEDRADRRDSLLAAVTRLDESAASLETLQTTPDEPGQQRIAEVERDLETIDRGIDEYRQLSPSTIVSPFEGRARQVVSTQVRLRDYYAPAVIVLLLQHLVVTFVSLSLVRERELGTTELFRVAPITPTETIVGKYLAYVLIGGLVATVLTAALVLGLGTPLAGSLLAVAAVLLLIIAASIGLGFVIAMVSRSDSQAVQYAMLVLLASIFFTGFLLSLDRFRAWVSWIAIPLPALEGIAALRDIMLRGALLTQRTTLVLGGLGVAYLVASWVLLVRAQRRA